MTNLYPYRSSTTPSIAAQDDPRYETPGGAQEKVDSSLESFEAKTQNIKDLSVTTPKIAIGAVGGPQLDPDLLKQYPDVAVVAKFEQVDEQFADMTLNVQNFPRLSGETDDTLRVQRAINATPIGGNLLFPLNYYEFRNTLYVKKPINIVGVGIGEHQATDLHFYIDAGSTRDCAISIEYDVGLVGSSTRNISIRNVNLIYEWEALGLPARLHDGISTKHNTEYTVDIDIQNVRSRRFINGFYLYNTYIGQLRNCRATSCINGFNFPGFSTALLIEACYSQHNTTGVGFLINNIVYSSLVSCASDDNLVGYQISNSKSVTFVGCGSEGNRNTALYFAGGNNGITVSSFFSHENGASSTATSYGISIHADYTNKNITVDGLIEETISSSAYSRNTSIFFGGTPDTIEILNSTTKKTIAADALYLGSLGINGEYSGATAPTNGFHRRGKIIYNRDDAAYLNAPGWQAEKTGYANATTWTISTSYAVGVEVNNGTYVYRCLTAGTSGTTAIGSLTVNGDNTLTDGSVTWERIGSYITFRAVAALYREEDWTPTIITSGGTTGSGIVYSYQTGKYIRYGKMVMIQFAISVTTWDASATGGMFIGGLPFVVSTSTNVETSASVSTFSGLTLTSGMVLCSSYAGFSRLMLKNATNTGVTQIQATAAANGLTIKGSMIYQMI